MQQTFVNLPLDISNAISTILSQPENMQLLHNAEKLHNRYMRQDKEGKNAYIQNLTDALAYVGLRAPATYAQIYSALSQVQELIPSWKPQSVLDIGSGPGTGVWAAKSLWSSLTKATCMDQEKNFISMGQEILKNAPMSINIFWEHQNITEGLANSANISYDLIIIANVLNELSINQRMRVLDEAYTHCRGVMITIEPATPSGFHIIQDEAKRFTDNKALLSPYIDQVFVNSDEYWIHFPQRFIRPEFQRRIRQHMRSNSLTSSNWEEAKYSYFALGKIPPEKKPWGRCIGPVTKQKGFLTIPVLSSMGIHTIKVLKRHKKEYTFAKNLRWGESIKTRGKIEKI